MHKRELQTTVCLQELRDAREIGVLHKPSCSFINCSDASSKALRKQDLHHFSDFFIVSHFSFLLSKSSVLVCRLRS